MNWKEYKVNPGEGMFEKIERRVMIRRAWRISGVVATVAALVAGALLLFNIGQQKTQDVTTAYNDAIYAENALPAASLQTPHLQPSAEVAEPEVKPLQTAPAPEQIAAVAAEEVQEQPAIQEQPAASAENLLSETPQPSTAGAAASVQDIHQQEPENDMAETLDTDFAFLVPQSTIESIKADPPQPEPYHEDNVLWVPNIIIPNSDTEELRFFSVKATSALSNFHVYIYNRGGRQIFSSNDANFVWNATLNGTPVPQGAYVWVISYRDSNNIPCQRTGTVTVVR